MKRNNMKRNTLMQMWKRSMAGMLSVVLLMTSVDLTALAYQEDKSDYLSAADKEGNEIVKEDASWEEEFPNGTFAFKNEYINLLEDPEPETQKITIYRLGGTAGEATAKIAVSPAVSYLDEEGTEAVYANAAGNQDYKLEAEDPIGTSEDGQTSYSPVELNQEDVYETSFFDITFADGEWVKDVLVTPVDDEEHESQELALLTIYEVEGAEFTETANRATISIADNEEILPSEMGFEEASVYVDKAEQKALIKVKRTGALQYVSSVDYATQDGTAKAGTDFVKAEGTAAFSGDIDYFEIQVDLIDDKKESSEDLDFTILLSEPKGGTIKEGAGSIRVDLHNSNTSKEDNLATRLQSPDALDLTAQITTQEKAIAENDNEVITMPAASAEEEVEGEYTPANKNNRLSRSVVVEKNPLSFKGNQGTWAGRETNPESVGSWSSDGSGITKYADGAEISTDYDAYMALNIPGIYNRFTTIDWKVDCSTRKKLFWAYNYLSATYGALGNQSFCYKDSGNMEGRGDSNMDSHLNSEFNKNFWNVAGSNWLFKFRGDDAHGEGKGYAQGTINIRNPQYDYLVFKIRGTKYGNEQRPRYGRIKLYGFGTNRRALSQNPTVSVITPDDDDGLDSRFSEVKPVITLENGSGGTDGNGKLYYGSRLKVSKNEKAKQYTLSKAQLTTGSGGVLWNGNVDANKDYTYLELARQSNINEKVDESDLQIKTYLERSQKLNISYKPSILDEDTEAVIEEKKKKITSGITFNAKVFNADTCTFGDRNRQELTVTDDSDAQMYQTDNLKNVKSVNFHLDDGSLILYNNAAYSGNADIPIVSSHYNFESITFSVYTPDAISVERDPEILSISKIRLYVDENEDGAYDQGDELLKDVASEDYCMDEFQPVNGHSLVMQVEYAYMPSCVQIPPGADPNAKFSLTPSFVTTLTEESVKSQLTGEMQGYRDIVSKDGTADMYVHSEGKLSVPLGQDASPAKYNEGRKAFEWVPQWAGNLAKDYADPEQIYLDHTWMPNHFLAASSKEQVNQYLGCLQGNDTMVISSRIGTKVTAAQTAGFSTYPEMGAQSFEQEAVPGVDAPVDSGGVTSKMPDSADSSPSLALPSMEVGVGPVTYIMGVDEIGFSVGIPLTDGASDDSKEGNQQQLDQTKKAFENMNVFQKLRERSRKYGPDNPGFEGGDMRGKSNAPAFEMAVNSTFMWKYNKKTANFEFSTAMVAVAVSGSVKLQYRFSACPIFYVYLSMGGEMNMKTGLEVAINEDANGNQVNEVKFAGLVMEPSVFIEAGAGVGIDIAKIEVYVHVSVSMAMTLGGDEDFSFDKFETGAAVGFNAVFLFFSFKMDLVGCTAGYDKEEKDNGSDGWYFKWSLCGKEMRSRSVGPPPEIPGANVTVDPPKDTSGTQNFYSSDDNVPREIMPFAIDLDGMPFQSSGYGNSTAAVKLAEGLDAAAGYELLTAGDKNYLLYTISRETGGTGRDTDVTQIVLSELSTTSSSGDDVKGLANPVDPTSDRPYIVVDLKGGQEDPMGDLEFSTYVKDGTIFVTWTSYGEKAYEGVNWSWPEQKILAEISKHVVVKTASFNPEQDSAFTNAVIAAGEEGQQPTPNTAGYRFLPKEVNDKILFFGEGEPYSAEVLKQKEEEYKAYYEAAADGNVPNGNGGTGDPYANANYQYSVLTDSLYGQYTKLNFAVKQKDGTYKRLTMEPSNTWKEQGARIDYVRLMEDGQNAFFLAYATSQEEIKTVNEAQDKQTVKKLYLQKVSVKEDVNSKETVLDPGKPVLIKTLVDSELDNELDGEYRGGQLASKFEAPAFNNLKFLNGKLKADGGSETFFLFCMNGLTYVVDRANLDLFCAGTPGSIQTFFAADENGNSQADTVIGADGDGNISAVYTDTVPNTVNNALYLTKYDPTTGTFGEGTMLAMNHMQVYEDAQSGNWSPEETKEAFFDEGKGGAMNKFSFAQPQIALGTPTTEEAQGTLTMVTQGTYTDLVNTTITKPNGEQVEEVIPDMQNGISGEMGVYALTYGIGKQQMGEEAILLDVEEFVPGSSLNASISFRNTGDVAIRASESNPASIKLYASRKDGGDARKLAAWNLITNVLAGQQVTTDAVQTGDLPQDIAERVLYFEVSEDPDYMGEGAFFSSTFDNDDGLGKIVVGNRAEVKISEITVSAGKDMKRENINGKDSVIVDLDMTIQNKGVQDAGNIRIQLERTDGKSETGENNYIPLALGRALVTYEGQSGSQDLTTSGTDGVYKVKNCVETDASGKESVAAADAVQAGRFIRLKGKITLPIECFDETSPKEAMNLRFTVLTDAKEYTEKNNTSFISFDPVTQLSVPSTVSLTLGNTVNIDVSYVGAARKNANISATEMVLSTAGEAVEASADDRILDMLAYNPANGKLSVRAGKIGSGVIRIADTATNSYEDVVFTNTADGTNIALTNKAITFENSAQGKWEDREIGKITSDAVLPYNHDICVGKKEGSFTFTTYASSIDLYFNGKAEVSSKNSFGFGSVIVTGSGKGTEKDYLEPVTVDFKNSTLQKHEVTVSVLGEKAEFDKLIEKYGAEGDIGDIVEKETNAPRIYFGKIVTDQPRFPKGTAVKIPVYIYDDTAINSVSIDGGGAETFTHQGFAKGTLTVTEGRNYRVVAVDAYGNRAVSDIDASGWYEEAASGQTEDDYPSITAEAVDEAGEPITDFTNGAAYIRYHAAASKGIQWINIYSFDPLNGSETLLGKTIVPEGEPAQASSIHEVPIPSNGYYKIEVADKLDHHSVGIFYLDCLSNGPEVNLYLSPVQSGKLFYSVGSQKNEAVLTEMVIYRGKVTQTNPDSIIVDNADQALYKAYSEKAVTWDTGTIDLKGSSVYTILAKDVSGQIRTFIYSDNSTLSGLAVHAEGYKLEMEAFSPYQYAYHVRLPYGFPEDQLPSVEYSISEEAIQAGAAVNKKSEGDKITVTLSYNDVDTDYVIHFEREVCTCQVSLRAYDDNIIIPYGQDTFDKQLMTRASVTGCSVSGHENNTAENLKYSYRIVEGQNYVEVTEDGLVTYKNFPKGSIGVEAKIEVTAYNDIASDTAAANLKITREYRLHLETTHCGHIETGEDPDSEEEMEESTEESTEQSTEQSTEPGTRGSEAGSGSVSVLPTEDGGKSIDFDLTAGENYRFEAFADEGCIFEGWADKNGEIMQKENEVVGNLADNLTLKAIFKDVTPPSASIDLKAMEKPEEGEGKDEILYSREAIEIIVNGKDHESGVQSIQYQIVEAGETYDETAGWKDYTEPVVLENDIFAVVYARVEDLDGNVTMVHSKEVLIDKEGQKLLLTPNFTSGEWTRKEDAQIHVLAMQGASPIKRVTYIVDGKAYLREQDQFTITGLKDGDYEVKVIAEDKAGNIMTEAVQVRKETVDTTIKVNGNPTELVREATLTAEVTTGVSGLKEIKVNGKKIEGNTYKLKESENGTYVFAATSNGGSTATVTLVVTNMIIKVEGIEAAEDQISLATGKTRQISWKVLPEDATYQQVTFTSSDEDKVTVDEKGLITAHKEGDAVITITSVDNPSVNTQTAMDLFEEYKLHTFVDVGGKVEYDGKTLITSEEGGQTEADIYLRKGTGYTLKAVPLKGYEFTGWKNEKGELVQREAAISSKLMKDVSLYAEFRDNVAPQGEILLKELSNPEGVEMLAKLAEEPQEICAYSSRGFQVTIEGGDVPSGVKSVDYQVLNTDEVLEETKGWQEYREPFRLDEDSDVIVYARIEDQDSNVTVIHSKEIIIDHRGVTIEAVPNFIPDKWNNATDNQIHVIVKENVTKLKKTTYQIDGEEFEISDKEFTLDSLKDGDYEIKVVTEDAAGNQVEAVVRLKQDTSRPTLKVLGNPAGLVRSATLEILAEPGISGLKEITVNGTAITGTTYSTKENGTYEIVVTNQAGAATTEKVKVTKVIVEVEDIQTVSEHEILLGKTWRASWEIIPANADFPQVTFASSDEKVATVSDTGLITVKKSGKAVITINSADNPDVKKEITIHVKLPKLQVKAVADQQIMLTWKGAAGAKEYWIYRASSADGKYRKIGKAKESAYRDKKARRGKTYYYKVRAIGREVRCNGEAGNAVKAKACLKTPGSVKVTISGKSYKVRWNKSQGAKFYTVYRSAKANGNYKKIGTTTRTFFVNPQSGIRKKWYYRVKAVGSRREWNSAASRGVTYQKKALLKKPALTIKSTRGMISLAWKKVSGATNYQIYRAESRWGIYAKIEEAAKVTVWKDKTVEKGKNYYYKVRPISRSGKTIKRTGTLSNVKKAKAE